jgi:YD repeat-containing protein
LLRLIMTENLGRISFVDDPGLISQQDLFRFSSSGVLWRNPTTGFTGYYEMDSSGNLRGWHDIGGSSTSCLVY